MIFRVIGTSRRKSSQNFRRTPAFCQKVPVTFLAE
jgi:hypothetical protein